MLEEWGHPISNRSTEQGGIVLTCPVCNGKTSLRKFFFKDQYRELLQCVVCGHAFDINHETSESGYASDECYGMVSGEILNYDRDLSLAKTLVSSYLIRPGDRVLDYGAGQGGIALRLAQISEEYSLGISVGCYEPIATLANLIHERNPSVEIFSDVKLCSNYDFVIAKEVIEHTNNPASFLKSLARTMKIGGTLFISCPGHPDALTGAPKNMFDYQTKNHLHFFTKDSMRILLDSVGLFEFCFVAIVDQYPEYTKQSYTSNEKTDLILKMLHSRCQHEADHIQVLLRRKNNNMNTD